ncbi:MAG: hypothetical protein L6R38_001440 [Xanthoria sp. 2 TBL-2021]|nr:MAG: hypothetical protein L6R38_001440 [Xanthoria sp. 2 TBL-2021]
MATSESERPAMNSPAAQRLPEVFGAKLRRLDSDWAQLSSGLQETSTIVQTLKRKTQRKTQALHSFQTLLRNRHSAFHPKSTGSALHRYSDTTQGLFAMTLRKVSREVDGLLETQQAITTETAGIEHELSLASVQREVGLRLRRQIEVSCRRLRGQGPAPVTSSVRRSTRISKQARRVV